MVFKNVPRRAIAKDVGLPPSSLSVTTERYIQHVLPTCAASSGPNHILCPTAAWLQNETAHRATAGENSTLKLTPCVINSSQTLAQSCLRSNRVDSPVPVLLLRASDSVNLADCGKNTLKTLSSLLFVLPFPAVTLSALNTTF